MANDFGLGIASGYLAGSFMYLICCQSVCFCVNVGSDCSILFQSENKIGSWKNHSSRQRNRQISDLRRPKWRKPNYFCVNQKAKIPRIINMAPGRNIQTRHQICCRLMLTFTQLKSGKKSVLGFSDWFDPIIFFRFFIQCISWIALIQFSFVFQFRRIRKTRTRNETRMRICFGKD